MRPYNPANQQSHSFTLQVGPDHQVQFSRTPQRNRSEKTQASTAYALDLTPLVSPSRLFNKFIPNHLSYRMEHIQTPCRHNYNPMFHLFDQNPITQVHLEYPSENFLFEDEEQNEVRSSHEGSEQSRFQNDNHQENDNPEQDSKQFQTQNIEALDPSTKYDLKRPSPEISEDSKEKPEDGKKCICNCKKTQCLKLYCDCFREGESCGSTCQCNSCHNTEKYEEERSEVRRILMKRNPEAFNAKIVNDEHSKGCNCKKTECIKKYCQCFQAGKKCGTHCKCEECKNGLQDSDSMYEKEDRFKSTAKKPRRMREL